MWSNKKPSFLVCTFLAAGSLIFYYFNRNRRLYPTPQQPAKQSSDSTVDELLLHEQLTRTEQFFGQPALDKIKRSYVVIVGLGGVGSHAALSLARNGIGKLRIIDFDQVSLSSLNRHSNATRKDVGVSKVECLKRHINEIIPSCRVIAINQLFNEQVAAELLIGDGGDMPDFVLDCIDNIPTKVSLIEFCLKNEIPLICSGGAGGKCDPTRIRIDDIKNTSQDELTRAIRHKLKKAGVESGVKFVYSTERLTRQLSPLHDHQQENSLDYKPLDGFRVRVMPVISPLAAIFGQTMACYVLCEMSGLGIDGLVGSTKETEAIRMLTRQNYKKLYEVCRQCRSSAASSVALSYEKTFEIFCTKFNGVSPLSGKQRSPGSMQIVPWKKYSSNIAEDLMKENNQVCLGRSEALLHIRQWEDPNLNYHNEVLDIFMSSF